MTTDDRIAELVRWMRESSRVVALTGAGVSTDSGIPDFRSPKSGLWARVDPMQVASIDGFHADPVAFYAFWRERFGSLAESEPNLTHRVLAQLESRGLLRAIVTQNIDGLHQRAGSVEVLEVHGTWRTARCLQCGAGDDTMRLLAELRPGERPTCAVCAGLVKPDVVLFGEPLARDFEKAERAIDRCDLLLAIGTSMEVWPVAGLAPRAHRAGARVVVINREETAIDDEADLVIHVELSAFAQRVARELDF
ncbi:MAG: NAD-dependent deacylase [Myxococcota bacterium]|nr:NAD-dependent deacylase [Myxococcota bacterium]